MPASPESLNRRLAQALPRLALAKAGGLASLILALPNLTPPLPQGNGPGFQFVRPCTGHIRAGYGSVAQWRASGAKRLACLRAAALEAGRDWQRLDIDDTGLDAFAMLAFAASPQQAEGHCPNALFWIPEVAVHQVDGQAALVLTTRLPTTAPALQQRWQPWVRRFYAGQAAPAGPASEDLALQRLASLPDFPTWSRLVEMALAEFQATRLQKVVLSRRVRLIGQRPFRLERLLAVLSESFPTCQVIQIACEGRHFLAATPERLFTQRGLELEVDAIAGTVGRAVQAAQDAALSDALRTSAKDLHEHGLVIEAIREALLPHCRQVEVPAQPRLMRLNNAQHLWSPISARLLPGMDAFRLAECLHPTPATNGEPRQAAHAWLRAQEPFERGWFTGAAGIVNPDLSGDLWVLLRCAEIAGRHADLYAGAGLVAGSKPQAEWLETEDKLAAMATALHSA